MERFSLRLVREEAPPPFGEQITGISAAADICGRLLNDEPHEVSLVLHLDRKHRIRGYSEVGRGGIAHAPMDAREVLVSALHAGAAAIIVAHNHPSGDPEPSVDDVKVTARLKEAAELVGLEFVDHLVIGHDGAHVSLRERGCLR